MVCRDLDEHISHLLVTLESREATHDGQEISFLLSLLRLRLRLDAVFVAQFQAGRRVFRMVSSAPGKSVIVAGDSHPSEDSWCQCLVRKTLPRLINDTALEPAVRQAPVLPIAVGAHIGTPVLLADGSVFGTVCGYSASPRLLDDRYVRVFQHVAQLIATTVDRKGEAALACGSAGTANGTYAGTGHGRHGRELRSLLAH